MQTDEEDCEQFKAAAAAIGMPAFVPYQGRRSRVSIDRVRGARTMEQARKRGRRQSNKSVARYEKGGCVSDQ
eukprot:5623805-Lingulodinium_polyedra.AAC.1